MAPATGLILEVAVQSVKRVRGCGNWDREFSGIYYIGEAFLVSQSAAPARPIRMASKAVCPMDTAEYDPLYLRGIAHFNACDFFESHEVWEELWTDCQGPSRKFFQGLIQAAVALHHFGNGNLPGAKKLYYGAKGYLEPFRPRFEGLDVDGFIEQMTACFREVIDSTEQYPAVEIQVDLIPEIHLDPPPAEMPEVTAED
jgi:hypothetical protein